MNSDTVYDITIIGAGPVGLFAAFYAGLRQANVKIIDSLPDLGGQPGMLYPEKNIYDIPAYPVIRASELITNLKQQLDRFQDTTTICLGEEVLSVEKTNDIFLLHTSKAVHYTKSIILACGNGAFSPRRLDLPGATEYEQGNLHYYVSSLETFRDRRVVLCGGGDSAVDWALALEPIAKEVTLVHRRNEFRAQEHSLRLLKQSHVRILTPFVPHELHGAKHQLHAISFKEARGESIQQIEADHFIVNYGFSSSLGQLKKWGFELHRNAICVSSTMETTIKGIYAIGDAAHYEGKVKLIATGFGEAPTAVNNALHQLDATQHLQPIHSSSLFLNE